MYSSLFNEELCKFSAWTGGGIEGAAIRAMGVGGRQGQ